MDEVGKYTAEELMEMVREVSSWDGQLDNLEVQENDEDFFNTYFEGRPMEAVRAVHFGNYNYNDEYVAFNGYGNLQSYDQFGFEELMADNESEIVEVATELNDEGYIDINHLLNKSEEGA